MTCSSRTSTTTSIPSCARHSTRTSRRAGAAAPISPTCAACAPSSPNGRRRKRHSSVASRMSQVVSPATSHQPPAATWWRDIPAWAQVAAALLFLGVSAGLANLDVRYNADGLTVRTGWSKAAPEAPVVQRGAGRQSREVRPAPWRADLTALEQQLRTEFRAASVVVAASAPAQASATPAGGSRPPHPCARGRVASAEERVLSAARRGAPRRQHAAPRGSRADRSESRTHSKQHGHRSGEAARDDQLSRARVFAKVGGLS